MKRKIKGRITRLDPSRTLTLRKQFQTDMRKRFNKLRKSLIELIVKEDALGLKQRKQLVFHAQDEPGKWITVKGNHIFIPEGRDVGEVIKEKFEDKDKAKSASKEPKPAKAVTKQIDTPEPAEPDKISEAEELAIREYSRGLYKSDVGGYTNIQGILRTGTPEYKDSWDEEKGKAHVKNLLSAFQKSTLSEEKTLYRGIRSTKEYNITDMKVGDEFFDKGVTSTSTSQQLVKKHFGRKLNRRDTTVYMTIKAAKGTHAIEIGGPEKEVAIAPNTTFIITKKLIRSGIIYLDVETVNKPQLTTHAQDEPGKWITVKGNHIFIPEGRDVGEVIKEKFEDKGKAKSTGKEPKIYAKKTDVEEVKGWANDPVRYQWKSKPGSLIHGKPLDIKELPKEIYHVTTAADKVDKSGVLLGQHADAGLGGGTEDGVSFTSSKSDADLIQRELLRSVKIAKGSLGIDDFPSIAREDEKIADLPEGTLDKAIASARMGYDLHVKLRTEEGKDPNTPSLMKDAYNHYLFARESAAEKVSESAKEAIKNPILYGDQAKLKEIDESQIKTLVVPKASLPSEALVTTGSDDFLHEVRVFADVPIKQSTSSSPKEPKPVKAVTKQVDTPESLPKEPGTIPVKPGYIRLYHQTSLDNLESIRKNGILYKHAKGIEGPKAVYASEQPFYGKNKNKLTIEFQVKKDEFFGTQVTRDITPDDFIAVHEPWHSHAKYIESDSKALKETLAGDNDRLLEYPEYKAAIEYIKKKYGEPQVNAAGRWLFQSTEQKLKAFQQWLKQRIAMYLVKEQIDDGEDAWWNRYIMEGFKKGTARAFDDTRPQVRAAMQKDQQAVSDFYAGTKDEFLRSSFNWPTSREKIKLLASRTYTDLKGVTEGMAARISHNLVDGLTKGDSPLTIARQLSKDVDISRSRAETIARTECLPGETLVSAAVVRAVFRRWYSGPMVEIKTSSGCILSATPNHPMLTQNGWIAAGLLQQGDYLIRDAREQDTSTSSDANINCSPSTLREIYDSLSTVCILERDHCVSSDFHSDGIEGNVDILRPNRELMVGRFSPIYKPLVQLHLTGANETTAPICPLCGRLLSINKQECLCKSSQRSPSSNQPVTNNITADSQTISDSTQRFPTLITPHDVRNAQTLDELVSNSSSLPRVGLSFRDGSADTSIAKNGSDCLLVTSNLSSNLPLSEPSKIKLDNVILVTVSHFDGHVYNLETPYGYYNANTYYTGNTIRCHAEGQLDAFEKLGVTAVGVMAEWSTAEDDKVCPLCQPLNGTVLKVQEARGLLPRHPNCFISPRVNIYTADGWKHISDINIGELVLTHKGRFRRVIQTHRNMGDSELVVNFKIGWGGTGHQIAVTGDHPIMVGNSWIPAKNIRVGDKVNWLSSYCRGCGKPLPYGLRYCDVNCQWLDEEHRTNVGKKNSEANLRQYASGERDGSVSTQAAHTRVREMLADGTFPMPRLSGEANPAKRLEVRMKIRESKLGDKNPMRVHPEIGKANGRALAKYIRLHPEKHANHICAARGHKTGIERKMEHQLIKLGLSPVFQYHSGGLWIDFAFPEQMVAVECDGNYWHKDKDRDAARDKRLRKLGWTVLHFTENQINDTPVSCASKVQRVLNNHEGKYSFAEFEVVEVSHRVSGRVVLYNLSVAEDESYVAKGCVVHNCRCAWIPANVGEDEKTQKRSKSAIELAIEKSYKAELPSTSKRTIAEQKKLSRWGGADKVISKKRPQSILKQG